MDMNEGLNFETSDLAYKSLSKLGGVASLIVALLTLLEVVVLAFYPQPGTVESWFKLFQSNKLIGILDYWGLEIIMYLLFILVFLAIYVVLRKINKSLMAIAITLALLGIGIFLATNNPFSMLSLSNQYALATSEAGRSTILAAGQAMLANTSQRAVGGFNMGLFLVSVAGLIISLVMFKSVSFSKATANIGVLAYGLSLTDYLREALTSSAFVTLLVIVPYTLLLMVWFVLVGLRLYELGSKETVESR